MKFTKENAVEKLNAALTNGGKKTLRLSKRTLESQTETLMALIANEEMEVDEFVSKVKPMLETANSNAEHDQSEFIKQYKNEHPVTEPSPEPRQEGNDVNKAILERLEAMEKREQERIAAASMATKRSDIAKYLSDNNVKDPQWIEKMLGITTIGENDTVEDKGKSLLEIYNISHSAGGSFTPGFSNAGGDDDDTDAFAELKSIRKSRSVVEQ